MTTSSTPDQGDTQTETPTDTESAGTAPNESAAGTAQVATTGSKDADTGRQDSGSSYPSSKSGGLGSAWVGLVLGALVTILLLVFVVQNNTSSDVSFLVWDFSLPLGVLVLFAAIAGALIMALFAGFRILQLRMRARKARKLSRK